MDKNIIPIFVLNLDRAPERKAGMISQFQKLGIENYYFMPAYDGRYITNLTFNANIGMGYGKGRLFQKGELAIIMTHLAIIKNANMMGYEEIIVLEDDVILCEDWYKRLDILKEKLPEDWDYVYLSGHSDYVNFKKYEDPTLISSPKMVGAFSYMVNKLAYKKISNYCTSFMTTFDDMIMHMIDQGKIKSFTYFPFMTFHNADGSFVWDSKPGHIAHSNNMHSSYKYFKNKI
jgi:GR25 family glycosyltransferase involved in LPS biosynthesis